ncbi:MAG TPA: hypothetical protein PLL30_15440 [Candidatus Krumholzibacteria bacterium]|nr:hypothetical protein [Candidatus Krumholzibacteria bacterium]HPD73164.1 hypothetical protein [Candidatus Krumholzibacteria bacterium]HRY41958.1 hypothetical protein [Candidatus Krumholzibacteria bacterium]
MKSSLTFLSLTLALALAGPALADTFVEPFDGGSNVGGWTFGAPVETIPASGGNPGAYLRAEGLDTFAPWPRTTLGVDSPYTGDYRALGVESVGVDLRTFYVDFSADDRALSLMLYSDNGTPGFVDDDWAGYTLGPLAPTPDDGWLSYDFAVPVNETDWPAGWSWLVFGGSSPPSPDWNLLVADVASLMFSFGDPSGFYIFQMWQLGLDNPRITTGEVATQARTLSEVKALFR